MLEIFTDYSSTGNGPNIVLSDIIFRPIHINIALQSRRIKVFIIFFNRKSLYNIELKVLNLYNILKFIDND